MSRLSITLSIFFPLPRELNDYILMFIVIHDILRSVVLKLVGVIEPNNVMRACTEPFFITWSGSRKFWCWGMQFELG